jgi:hypothetical protein
LFDWLRMPLTLNPRWPRRSRPAWLPGGAAERRGRRHDTRQERAELREVAAVQGQLDDLALIDDDAERGVGGLDQRRIRRNGHALRDAADGELDVDPGAALDGHGDAVTNERLEPVQRALDLIAARTQQRHVEVAVVAGDRRPGLTRPDVGHLDGDPRQHGPDSSVTVPTIVPVPGRVASQRKPRRSEEE